MGNIYLKLVASVQEERIFLRRTILVDDIFDS